MAHPLRVQLLELLADEGPATASGLARAVGQTSGTTSYHLRRLAAVGLIEEDRDQSNQRDRYWRRVERWTIDTDALDSPTAREAAEAVVDEVLRSRMNRLRRWHQQASQWPRQWREAAIESTVRLDLTVEQTAELSRRLTELLDEYRQSVEADAPAGSRQRIVVETDVIPNGDPKSAP